MINSKEKIADFLLQIKAVEISPEKPFIWASGWKAPIYCDNRKTLSFPEIRTFIKNEFVKLINNKFETVEAIAGVATSGIPYATLIADTMNLPMIYVRAKPKKHGKGKQIEGVLSPGTKVLVVEDLISTGKSSLNAAQAIIEHEANVLGIIAIFSYRFSAADSNFKKNNCHYEVLTDYETLLKVALEKKYILEKHLSILKSWRKDPENFLRNVDT